jgi:hypothetical protein
VWSFEELRDAQDVRVCAPPESGARDVRIPGSWPGDDVDALDSAGVGVGAGVGSGGGASAEPAGGTASSRYARARHEEQIPWLVSGGATAPGAHQAHALSAFESLTWRTRV